MKFYCILIFLCYSRTPGSRQPSPSDEDKNNSGVGGVVVLENPHVGHHLMGHGHPHAFPPPPPHHSLVNLDSHFEHVMALDPGNFEAGAQAPQGSYPGNPQQAQQPPAPTQQQAMDSSTVLPTSFDVQVSMANLFFYFFNY